MDLLGLAQKYAEGALDDIGKYDEGIQSAIKILAEDHPSGKKIWYALNKGIRDIRSGEIKCEGAISSNQRSFLLHLGGVHRIWDSRISVSSFRDVSPETLESWSHNIMRHIEIETEINRVSVMIRHAIIKIDWDI